MLDTFKIYTELKESMEAIAAEKIASMVGLLYEELQQSVTKTEFNELKAVIKDLAYAQKASEGRLTGLENVVTELGEAQNRTEQRVKELTDAQKASEGRLTRLENVVTELSEAQKASEKRLSRLENVVTELGEAQKELTEAQNRTEKTVRQLAKQVGGLSDVAGGDLEYIAYIVLHDVLKREFGWKVGVLERVWQNWGREPEEVDIFGQATDPKEPDKTLWIVGEAKHNISLKEVKKFIKQLERAREHLSGEIFPVIFCYRARPEVQQMILDADIRLVFSYGKLL
jgi:response regulator RpfG family c-di-GMP phosphodiesterase